MKKLLISIFLIIVSIASFAQNKALCIQPSCKQTVKTTDSVNIFVQLTATDGYKAITWSQIGGPLVVIPVPQVTTWNTNINAQSSFTLKNLGVGTYVFNALGVSQTGGSMPTSDTVVVIAAPRAIAYVMTVYTDSSRVKNQ